MELALYCPVYGYYEKEEDKPGRGGDFYTSVSVGSLFSELLAFQFVEWLETAPSSANAPEKGKTESSPVQIVEAGAHDGQLANDILTWLREHRRALFDRLEYQIVEPSAVLAARQRRMLAEFPRIRWLDDIGKAERIRGIILSNELLDAIPVHRYGWDANEKKWFEWGVTVENGDFKWARLTHAIPPADNWPAELAAILPDGFIREESPMAKEWWSRAARMLEWGKLVTLDYGFNMEEILQRPHGTLRAYRDHRVTADVLADAGEQDLTAHVDFTAIREAGEAVGLETEFFGGQEQFLTRIAASAWKERSGFGAWGSAQTRQFQTLTHPEHLGRFRVLVQRR